MRSDKKSDKFFVYIVISLVIHLVVILFFPYGSLSGVVNSKDNNVREFGFVQFVEFKPAPSVETKPVKPEKKPAPPKPEKKKKKKQEKKEDPPPEKKEVKEKTVKKPEVKRNKSEKNIEQNETDKIAKKNNQNKTADKQTTKTNNKELISSKDSDLEIKVEEEKKEKTSVKVKENKKPESKPKPETKSKPEPEEKAVSEENGSKSESEPAPPPPPTAGELIGISPKPVYPKYLVGEAKTGKVKLAVNVSPNGKVNNIYIIKSSGIDKMDRNALITIKRGWKFKSYKKEYTIKINVEYLIDNKDNSRVNVDLENISFE